MKKFMLLLCIGAVVVANAADSNYYQSLVPAAQTMELEPEILVGFMAKEGLIFYHWTKEEQKRVKGPFRVIQEFKLHVTGMPRDWGNMDERVLKKSDNVRLVQQKEIRRKQLES